MQERIIETEADRIDAARFIQNRAVPFTLRFYEGKKRSLAQNRLQHLWYKEAAEQLGDDDTEGYRAYCKAHFGVPIRCEDDDYRASYDKYIRPLPYETKIAYMRKPIDLPVTRDMNTKQESRYLDAVFVHLHGRGVKLTQPEEQTHAAG